MSRRIGLMMVSVMVSVMVIVVVVAFMIRQRQRRPYRVYCITLPDDHERRERLLASAGDTITIEFIPAIDTRGERWRHFAGFLGTEGKDQLEWTTKMGFRRQHSDLTPGAVGCFLSHLECYRRFLQQTSEDNDDVLVILEDDSEPRPHFSEKLHDILNSMPPDTDLCMIHHEIHGSTQCLPKDPRFSSLDNGSAFYRLNCYAITRGGAQKIMDHFGETGACFHEQLDTYLTSLCHMGILRMYFWHDTTVCPPSTMARTNIQTIGVVT